MKSFLNVFIFIIVPMWIYPQNSDKVLSNFKSCKNDSIYISQNSIYPYEGYSINKCFDYDSTSLITKQILSGQVGDFIGPFENDSVVNLFKITNIEYAYQIRVGNIWIDIKRGYENAKERAETILTEVKEGKAYNTFCHLYSDDKNKKKDCDLGWFYNVIMVEPFAREIIKHKIGDVFVVETKYGFHVVKILGNPYLDLMKVDYIGLTIKK